MPNNHQDSFANTALQSYLDDLTSNRAIADLSKTNDEIAAQTGNLFMDEQKKQASDQSNNAKQLTISKPSNGLDKRNVLVNTKDEKISNAERLLAQVNSIHSLSAPVPEKKITEQSLDTQKTDIGSVSSLEKESALIRKSVLQDKEISIYADNTSKEQEARAFRDEDFSLQDSLPTRFQVLLCDVFDITVALPLIELGGIHKIDKLAMVAQKPSWFKGLLIKGEQQYNCIDAATWLVPHKHAVKRLEKGAQANSEYQFAVQLGKSEYALCCHKIRHTIELEKGDVKWRKSTQTHPWLAGLLKDKMCALIDSKKMVQEVLN